MLTIFKKELRSYFTSATGFVFMGIFLLLSGIFFALANILSGSAYYNTVLSNISFVFLLIVPILTMRTISEETRSKTDQLLLTSPQSIVGIVLGKYFAAVALFAITLCITILYPIILLLFAKIAFAEIISAYLGFFLMGCCFIAVGVFISSLTESQVVAAVGTFGAMLLIWILDSLQSSVPTSALAGLIFILIIVAAITAVVYSSIRNQIATGATAIILAGAAVAVFFAKKVLYEGLIAKVMTWISLIQRNDKFNMGVLQLNSIIFFISFAFIFVFFTIKVIEKRRWN
jgi:ABC-2 type transport system permease protein